MVKIETHNFKYSYEYPWVSPRIERSGGTGFIVEFLDKKWILTNAHVVSNAAQILVRREGAKNFFYARVVHIAHDCDLALIDIDQKKNNWISNNDDFYEGTKALEIGKMPELNSPVVVIGFPIGGEKVSITKGIISRIDMDSYAHSGVDSHLVIQVDAAINPGNSGGPAIQNGKVVGVAFQIYRSGENLGYLIPPPVIGKFFNDIRKDGKYNGYIELGVLDQSTENPMMREALNLDEQYKDLGVFVYDILPGSSADGYLQSGDVILSIQGLQVSKNKEVFINQEYRNYVELIDNLEEGELIELEILRNKKKIKVSFPARITNFLDFQRKSYDEPPEFFLMGSLLFQPLNQDLILTFSSIWLSEERSDIFYYFYYAIQNRTTIENQQIIILTKVLDKSYDEYEYLILEKINNKKVKNLADLKRVFDSEVSHSRFIVFQFTGNSIPLVVETKSLLENIEKVKNNYKLNKIFNIKNTK